MPSKGSRQDDEEKLKKSIVKTKLEDSTDIG